MIQVFFFAGFSLVTLNPLARPEIHDAATTSCWLPSGETKPSDVKAIQVGRWEAGEASGAEAVRIGMVCNGGVFN